MPSLYLICDGKKFFDVGVDQISKATEKTNKKEIEANPERTLDLQTPIRGKD